MAHGNKSRERNRLKRLAQKRARKASMKALYEERRRTGQNKKSKRVRRNAKGGNKTVVPDREVMMVTVMVNGETMKAERRVHGGPKCRNIGCKKCSLLWN